MIAMRYSVIIVLLIYRVSAKLNLGAFCENGVLLNKMDYPEEKFETWLSSVRSSIAYIQFAKVGSTTMRTFLWNTTNFHLALKGEKLKQSKNFIYNEKQQRDGIRNAYQGGFGLCEEYFTTGGSPCLYLTTLRHPLHRVMSSYKYFCRSCEEDGRFCNTSRGVHFPNCPNATLLEWAAFEGNVYVNDFSLYDACVAQSLQYPLKDYFAARSRYVSFEELRELMTASSGHDRSLDVRPVAYLPTRSIGQLPEQTLRIEAAIQNAVNRNVVALPVELINFSELQKVLQLPTRRQIPSKYTANKGRYHMRGERRMEKLSEILKPDIVFFEHMEGQWRNEDLSDGIRLSSNYAARMLRRMVTGSN